MAEPEQGAETVRLNVREVLDAEKAAQAEASAAVAEEAPAVPHDGRFGEHFDDELSISGILYVTIGLAAVTALGFLFSLWVYNWAAAEYGHPSDEPAAVDRAALPPGPLLQRSPEEELREMRLEVDERLHGYGWADEAAGTVYIPIEKAIDLVAAGGLPAAAPAPPAEEETPEEVAP